LRYLKAVVENKKRIWAQDMIEFLLAAKAAAESSGPSLDNDALREFHRRCDDIQAERDLRMVKAKAKISGCFRAVDGGAVFAALKSYTSTLRKNHRNIFDGIRVAFNGSPVLCYVG